MTKGRKRKLCVLLACFLLLGLFSGCARDSTDQTETSIGKPNVIGEEGVVYYDEPVTIRVLVDYAYLHTAASNQVRNVIEAFQHDNVNVSVDLEVLPSDNNKYKQKLEQLRTEIAKGEGPDVYLLSTEADAFPDFLFPDVNEAMRNGTFLDLTNYYNTDVGLNFDGINTIVMEAGMVDHAQYTLPLRYDFPVVYVVPEQLDEMNLSSDMFSSGVMQMMDMIAWLENRQLAATTSFSLYDDCQVFFPELVDYDTGEVLLEEDELLELLETYSEFTTVRGTFQEYDPYWFGGSNYDFLSGAYWAEQGSGAWVGSVADAVQTAAMCQVLGCDLEMYPLTGPDGKVVAEVSYYGAIGSGTEQPDLAYNFLRRFLTEEIQWEQNASETNADETMAFPGYSILTVNSAGPYSKNLLNRCMKCRRSSIAKLDGLVYQLSEEAYSERISMMSAVELTDEDVPILQTYIDVARYPISSLQYELAWEYMNTTTSPQQTPDLQSVVEIFIESLEAHMNNQ